MCTCFKDNLLRIKCEISKNLTEFEASTLHTEWQGASIFLDGSDRIPVNPVVSYEYQTKKTNGETAKNKKKNTVGMMARYCPFCGRDTKATT